MRPTRGTHGPSVWGAVVNSSVLGDQPEHRLRALAQAGYREVEASLILLTGLAPMLADVGLTPRSAFLPTELVTGRRDLWREDNEAFGVPPLPDTYSLDGALAQAARIDGVSNLTVAALLPGERRNLDDYRRFADQMNETGEHCAAAGLTLSFHAHSFDFEPLDGQVPIELLLSRFALHVASEVDVFWVAMAGQDPADFIRRQSGRIVSLHLKDRARTAPAYYTGWNRTLPRESYVPPGAGNLDFPAILEAARAAGVQYRFVEDESRSTRFEHLLEGIEYLKGLDP